MSQAPKIFISYSHDDIKELEQLKKHLKALRLEELEIWNDSNIKASAKWKDEIQNAIDSSNIAIVLVSASFLASDFINKQEIPMMLEAAKKRDMQIFPFIISACNWEIFPWLETIQARPLDNKRRQKPLEKMSKAVQNDALAKFTKEIYDLIISSPQQTIVHTSRGDTKKIHISHGFPSVPNDIIGRENELEWLNELCSYQNNIRIAYLEAFGGVGKTSTINRWLNDFSVDEYGDFDYVFVHSFYSQGSSDIHTASFEPVLEELLSFFGIHLSGVTNAFTKVELLAKKLAQIKALVVFDGLEPLQYPTTAAEHIRGALKDRELSYLFKTYTRQPQKNSLFIITTRQEIEDFKTLSSDFIQHKELHNLDKIHGVRLLKSKGVCGSQKELEAICDENGGHAFSLVLLAGYLVKVHKGEASKSALIPPLTKTNEGNKANKMLNAYFEYFKSLPHINWLYIVGLFDRPCGKEALKVLIDKNIQNLTDKLHSISAEDMADTLADLRGLHLVLESKDGNIDAHPLVREYFGNLFKTSYPDDSKNAHSVLYSYLKNSVNGLPNTLAEMEPLFRAIWHGCKAGKHKEAFGEVYAKKILRYKQESFIAFKLGAFGSNLACLANFFDKPFDVISDNLSDDEKGFLLNNSSFALSAIGRMRESIPLCQLRLEKAKQMKQYGGIASELRNFSDTYWHIGELKNSMDSAKEGLLRSKSKRDTQALLSYLALSVTAIGESGVENIFQKAEKLEKELNSSEPYLYSGRGFRYCIFLIESGKYGEVIKRAEHTVETAKRYGRLLDIGLDTLTIGRGYHLKWLDKKDDNDKKTSEIKLNSAVEELRKASIEAYLAMGLLARAEFLIDCKEFTKAENDLAEVYEIVNREMKLHMADYWLCSCKLAIATHTDEKEPWGRAKNLIEEIGYGLRYKKLEELAAQIDIEYTPPPILAIDLSDIEELLR